MSLNLCICNGQVSENAFREIKHTINQAVALRKKTILLTKNLPDKCKVLRSIPSVKKKSFSMHRKRERELLWRS